MGEVIFGGPALLARVVVDVALLPEPLGGPAPLLVLGGPALLQLFVLGLAPLLLVLIGGAASQLQLLVLGAPFL